MQQTETYRLNLINGSDSFSPDPLNDNAVKLEAALKDQKAETEAALAAQKKQMNTALESQRTEVNLLVSGQNTKLTDKVRLVTGSYLGNGSYGQANPTVVEVADAERPPRLIIVSEIQGNRKAELIRGMTGSYIYWMGLDSYEIVVEWTARGARWYCTREALAQLNSYGTTYYYAVFI